VAASGLARRAVRRLDRQGTAQGQRDHGPGWRGETTGRPRARRCQVGSRAWKSSRRRAGTSRATTGAPPVRGAGPARSPGGRPLTQALSSQTTHRASGAADFGFRRIRPSARPQDTGHRPNCGSEISSSPPGTSCTQTAGRTIRLGGKPPRRLDQRLNDCSSRHPLRACGARVGTWLAPRPRTPTPPVRCCSTLRATLVADELRHVR
jgi:hypothetical protein